MRGFIASALAFSFAAALAATPVTAQTFTAASKGLPLPVVVPLPQTFGSARPRPVGLDRPVNAGEYASRIHTERDRIAILERTQALRHARETALIAKRGAGTPIVLRSARY